MSIRYIHQIKPMDRHTVDNVKKISCRKTFLVYKTDLHSPPIRPCSYRRSTPLSSQMFAHQLCFLLFSSRGCRTPAEQQPAVQIQLHHWCAAGQDQGVERGRRWLQDLERCGRQPGVERPRQQRRPADSTGGMSVKSYVKAWDAMSFWEYEPSIYFSWQTDFLN